jgi:hypothetical protein
MSIPFNFDVTSTRTHGVAETFFDAVHAFNNQKWPALLKLLDQNVVVYNVSNVNYILGYAAAQKYFEGITDPETFAPTNQITFFPTIYPLSVRGVALWTHAAHGHVNVPIQYEFEFAPATFLITSMWAQHA